PPTELQPVHSRHADVDYEAVRSSEIRPSQELLGGGKHVGGKPNRADQGAQGFADRFIVVDNRNDRMVCHADTHTAWRGPASIMRWYVLLYVGIGDGERARDGYFGWGIPNFSAMRTRSARESAFILVITWPRWTLTVTSLVPSSAATCLFS